MIPYPSFTKCQDASRQGVPIARLFMAAIILLGQQWSQMTPDAVFAEVLKVAKEQ